MIRSSGDRPGSGSRTTEDWQLSLCIIVSDAFCPGSDPSAWDMDDASSDTPPILPVCPQIHLRPVAHTRFTMGPAFGDHGWQSGLNWRGDVEDYNFYNAEERY